MDANIHKPIASESPILNLNIGIDSRYVLTLTPFSLKNSLFQAPNVDTIYSPYISFYEVDIPLAYPSDIIGFSALTPFKIFPPKSIILFHKAFINLPGSIVKSDGEYRQISSSYIFI